MDVLKRIEECGLCPVVVIDNKEDALPTAEAMLKGGVDIMEVTFRTEAAADSIKLISEKCKDVVVGAGTVTTLDGKTFKIWDAEVIDIKEHTPVEGKECPNKAICHGEDGTKMRDVVPGTVTFVGKKTLIVKCQEGCLDIKEVQIEGKKRMTIEEFLRGRKIEPGYCLGR